ncbi:hypothetical protein Emag_004984 [Eimeria magna]
MQALAECSVVPMGRMPMDNALNGHPRRRVPQGGAKLNAKNGGRKKPSAKDVFGMTPLDLLGKVSVNDLPGPASFLQRLIGTYRSDTSDSQAQQEASPSAEAPASEQEQLQGQQQQQQLAPFAGPPAARLQQQLPPPQIDTRTNLEKYMGMKMQESRWRGQPLPANCMPPPQQYYSPPVPQNSAYGYQGGNMGFAAPQTLQNSPSFSPEIQQGAWDHQPSDYSYASQYGYESSGAPTPSYHAGSSAGVATPGGSAAGNYEPAEQQSSYIPEDVQQQGMQSGGASWLQNKCYLPQVPPFSHMTAPVPGAPFHPGFSYATDFKYYYNYYPADQYAGELDGEHADAQEEAVAREQQRADELVSRQLTEADTSACATTLQPLITSKKRLESGQAVAL